MAVEHKEETQPVENNLKNLQEGDNLENAGGKPVDKQNINGNTHDSHDSNNHNHDNNHEDDHTDTTDTGHDTRPPTNEAEGEEGRQEAGVEGEMASLGIAEPSNFSVKHPLQHGWTIWYDNPGKRTNHASWGDHLRTITTFDTVEDFWRVFNNLKPASTLPQGSNYHIFKEHIEPKWEDACNSKGGKWTVSIPPKSRAASLDQMWLWTVLACIGETVKSPDDVCGLVVSVRKAGDRVQIWTKDATNEAACRDIGRSLKETLELPDNVIIGYQSHADSMKKGSSRDKYSV